jgi:CubicO group peptidase (beta-lactamase class C family)
MSQHKFILEENKYRDEEELLQFIEDTMEAYEIPGLSISIVKNDNIVWEKYFGYANVDENITVDENTLFMLASVSKTVTATALMQLFEEGLFLMDDDIDDYLPFAVNHPDYLTPITFKMLLTHTSGIKDNWDVMPYYDGDSELELGYYLEQYLIPGGEFYDSNSSFTNSMPGTSFAYSNIGAALIGLLVEEISNQPFNIYCQENIFEPLSMNSAFWFLSEIENLNQVALPYVSVGGSGYVDDCSGDGDCCPESWIGDGFSDCEEQQWDCDLSCYDNDGGDCEDDGSNIYCGDGFCNGDEDYYICPEDCLESGCNEPSLGGYTHYGFSDYPSGQLRTTSNNLAKFMAAYINNGIYNGNRILESETVDLIKSIPYPNIDSEQGLIWYYKNTGVNGRTLFGHNGGDIGVTAEMFISNLDNIGVIILTNSSNYNAIIEIENSVFDFADMTDFIIAGDINSDSIINILDVILVVNIILGINDFNTLADINNDGEINILDIVSLVQIILLS